jgi:DNA-binding FadR family transcriptional regulator
MQLGPKPVQVRRVRKAYEQVADQLRELITTGGLSPGERLPNEALLADQFGVSRATVREALRVLSTQNLIRTAKGTGGGSYVTLPTVDHISQFLQASFSLLSHANEVSLSEFLEAREYLEVPAARLAAERRTQEDLLEIRSSIPADPLHLTVQEQFVYNKRWHGAVLDSCKNALLSTAAQPIFVVLQTNLQRSAAGRRFHSTINTDHQRITSAIADRDPKAAEHGMREHLIFLRPFYEDLWRAAARLGDKAPQLIPENAVTAAD